MKQTLLSKIINKLFALTIGFYAALIGCSALGLTESLLSGLESAATLTLGACLAVVKDTTTDNDDNNNNNNDNNII